MKKPALLIPIVLCFQLFFSSSVKAESPDPVQVKELNFVFLHGAGGHTGALQLLADTIMEQAEGYILDYSRTNPGTKITVNTLQRYYPNNVDIDTWANNIADSINKHFSNKKDLILIGHSMGGKAAIHAVAQNIGGLADKVKLVVTINSPIKSLGQYYFTGGVGYWQARWLLPPDLGVINSTVYYDSSQEASWVGYNKHWLAFISSEGAPFSSQFDVAGVDALPRDMDDSITPISAQYSDWADVVNYGEYGHNDFSVSKEVAGFMADKILRYIFGGSIECSVLARGGAFERKANWLPVMSRWQDIVGEFPVMSGCIWHINESYTQWREWEDVVGECYPGDKRSSYRVSRVSHFPFLTSIEEVNWMSSDNLNDCRLYIKTRAAPRSRVEVEWSIYRQGLLPPETSRDRYEVEIATGTPLTSVMGVSWATDDSRDVRLQVYSEAQGPYRWFHAQWRVYSKETRQRKVIDEIAASS